MASDADVLLDAAKEAINAVFADTTVPQSVTRERLVDLQDEIEVLFDTLEDREG